jgi:diadenosine tetraphosphate (Ap4A) HIT family hydrolase
MTFQLHPQLQKDCFLLGRFALSQVLLMNDCQFPWFILVPEREQVTEVFQLPPDERVLLQEESCFLAKALAAIFQADKMNIAAIGNIVPQLHIHHVVRFKTDLAWPAPVWGKLAAVPYSGNEKHEVIAKVRAKIAPRLID